MKKLFTDRQGMVAPRVKEELDEPNRTALLGFIEARIEENWFGAAFPFECQDGRGNAGTDSTKMKNMLGAYNVVWPQEWRKAGQVPTNAQVFDLIEFSYEHIAEPNAHSLHDYQGHYHYSYDQAAGRAKFTEEVSRIFERNGLAFELKEGEVTRIAPAVLHEALDAAVFKTGDDELDRLLETARDKFLNKSLEVRKEGLEKLWDAWERLKTVEPGSDKKVTSKALLDKAATEPVLREHLEIEAKELSWLGNNLMIRHTEVGKPPIAESAQVDYLFHRMFAIIRLLLKSSGRGG